MRHLLVLFLFAMMCSTANAQSWRPIDKSPCGGTYLSIIAHGDSLVAAPYYKSFLLMGGSEGPPWRRIDMPSAAAEAFSLLSPGSGRLLAGSFGRIYRSDDDGQTWSESYISELLGAIVTGLSGAGDTLFACGGGMLLRSVTRGASWNVLSSAPEADALLSVGQRVFCGGPTGIHISDDRGENWQRVWSTDSVLGLYAADGVVFAALRGISSSQASLLRSTDNGATWETTDLAGTSINTLIEHDGVYYSGCNIPEAAHHLFTSTDGGRHWTPVLENRVPFPRAVWHLHATPGGILVSLGGLGIWRLEDNADSWTFASEGHFRAAIARIGLTFRTGDHGHEYMYSIKENFLAVRPGDASSWEFLLYPGTERPMDMVVVGDTVFLAVTGGFYTTHDVGAHWEFRPTPFPDAPVQAFHYEIISKRIYAGGRGVPLVWTGNGGQSWTIVPWYGSTTQGPRNWNKITLWSVTSYQGIVAATSDGAHLFDGDTGPWRKLLDGAFYDAIWRHAPPCLAGESGLYMYHPEADSLVQVRSDPVYAISRCGGNRDVYYAVTRDSGLVWGGFDPPSPGVAINDGLPPVTFGPPSVCRILLSGDRLGSCGLEGLWIGPNCVPVGVEDEMLQPNSMVLFPAYPNPAFRTTSLDLSLHREKFVEITLVDRLGRILRKVHHGSLAPGRHTVHINVQNLPAGLYFCVARAGGRISTVPVSVLH